jgi:hypothetical protein
MATLAAMSTNSDPPLWVYLVLLAVVLPIGYWGCPNNSRARDILQAEGYTQIKTTGGGHGWSCGDDGSATGFTATGPGGGRVDGVVCCGLVVKACTVRVERAARHRPMTTEEVSAWKDGAASGRHELDGGAR